MNRVLIKRGVHLRIWLGSFGEEIVFFFFLVGDGGLVPRLLKIKRKNYKRICRGRVDPMTSSLNKESTTIGTTSKK